MVYLHVSMHFLQIKILYCVIVVTDMIIKGFKNLIYFSIQLFTIISCVVCLKMLFRPFDYTLEKLICLIRIAINSDANWLQIL